ncbi:MAG: hypothetical protein EA397_05290 [Deltaproteobacteria bacterium]|nr:MAG: hypothetical protein EA397_05290 [Deltaproteobacteria bacterium]
MRLRCTTAILALLLTGGCAGKNKNSGDVMRSANPHRDAVRERTLPDGLILEEIDLNNDGQAEIFNYYRVRSDGSRILVRKDTDLNRDGSIDARSWFDDSGMLTLEEFDGDFDGKIDIWDHYQDVNGDGKPERVFTEIDTTYDGRPNIFITYREGRVVRKERDTNGDGIIDHWEKFDSEGRVVRSGRDSNYDGTVDQRD